MDRLRTSLCDLLNIEYPILQSGMGSVAGPELVAAVSRAGGLGILAGLRLSAELPVTDHFSTFSLNGTMAKLVRVWLSPAFTAPKYWSTMRVSLLQAAAMRPRPRMTPVPRLLIPSSLLAW